VLKEPPQITQPIKFFEPQEIQNIIHGGLKPRKPSVYDIIAGRILKEMPRKGIVHLTAIWNSYIRTGYLRVQRKVAQIIMIPKPGKPLQLLSSYRQIFESSMPKRLCLILKEDRILPARTDRSSKILCLRDYA
jgi:hypothetical protein